jgi:hypothetical protein
MYLATGLAAPHAHAIEGVCVMYCDGDSDSGSGAGGRGYEYGENGLPARLGGAIRGP